VNKDRSFFLIWRSEQVRSDFVRAELDSAPKSRVTVQELPHVDAKGIALDRCEWHKSISKPSLADQRVKR
jgi:hypothetical protein